jgi:HPt (histidine-containing phosphotransfer) domain-containing protein
MAKAADGQTAKESNYDGDEQPILHPGDLAALAAETTLEIALAVVLEFRKELASHVAELAAAAAVHRSLDIQAVAHALYGVASSVGAVRLATLAKSIELDCASGLLDLALTKTLQLADIAAQTDEACRAYEATTVSATLAA